MWQCILYNRLKPVNSEKPIANVYMGDYRQLVHSRAENDKWQIMNSKKFNHNHCSKVTMPTNMLDGRSDFQVDFQLIFSWSYFLVVVVVVVVTVVVVLMLLSSFFLFIEELHFLLVRFYRSCPTRSRFIQTWTQRQRGWIQAPPTKYIFLTWLKGHRNRAHI